MEEYSRPKSGGVVFRLPGIRALRIPLRVPEPRTTLSSALFLVYGFASVIILGTGLLMLPVSSRSGQITSLVDALFTATSAVCLTGLVVVDTGTYWSTFGQGVILALFQVGGLGFITGATLIFLAMGRGLGLRGRLLIRDSMGIDRLGGVVGIGVRVTIFAVLVEAIGAAIFYLHWRAGDNPDLSLWRAAFHSISAFTNSGMDIFGNFKSLSDYQGDAVVLLTSAGLIILGGVGYLVVEDLLRSRRFARLTLESKLVLTVTISLLVLGTLFYLLAEFSNPNTLGPLPFLHKILVSFFQAVTPRTAGFTAIDIGGLNGVTLLFTMFLMAVGGAAGSLAGGMKVNTFGVLVMMAISSVKGHEHVEAFGREFTDQNVHRAVTVLVFYLGIVGLVVLALSITETFQLDRLLFETFSALGTVGLSTGITPDLSTAGRLIITLTMFIGRLGLLTFATLLVHRQQPATMGYPHETVRIG
ncbi:MAG: potassium transporter TrkG [Dehalococcoidales bacterium]|nr:potassium transporter TrkG [Dehalococcoidales bacterium]